MMTNNSPLISVIIPVYNAEKYLAETLDSVIAQDIGFEDNIEIILVNDGSTDNSEEICKSYQSKYPNNITYIKQKNAGVSAARNRGITKVKGKYLAFLDSDDKYSKDAVRRVIKFFDEHYDQIDVVSIKLQFFEASTEPHMLNYKYNSTRVIDINEEQDCIQLAGGSSFIKTEAVKLGDYKFDTRLQLTEDTKFLTEIILNREAYGVVVEPTYYYRKRHLKDSAVSSSFYNKSWYFDTPIYAYKYLTVLL